MLQAPFGATFPAAPRVRWDDYSLVWEACDGERLMRVSCSVLWDGELRDFMLQARVALPGQAHQLEFDHRLTTRHAYGRHLGFVSGKSRTEAKLLVAGDSLIIASVQAGDDEASRLAAERFLDSITIPPRAACPTLRLVKIDRDRPHGVPLVCGEQHGLPSARFGVAFSPGE